MKRMRVLVTGGAGFLGSHLCDRLIQEGKDVICVEKLFFGGGGEGGGEMGRLVVDSGWDGDIIFVGEQPCLDLLEAE